MATEAQLVVAFREAQQAHAAAYQALQAAEANVNAAGAALSALLVPVGAKNGQSFNVYVGADLVQITVGKNENAVSLKTNVRPPPEPEA